MRRPDFAAYWIATFRAGRYDARAWRRTDPDHAVHHVVHDMRTVAYSVPAEYAAEFRDWVASVFPDGAEIRELEDDELFV